MKILPRYPSSRHERIGEHTRPACPARRPAEQSFPAGHRKLHAGTRALPRSRVIRSAICRFSSAPGRSISSRSAPREHAVLTAEERNIVLDAVLHERIRFTLYAVCVMPDHVHLLMEPAIKEQDSDGAAIFFSLTEILDSLKSFTAHQINRVRGKTGSVWEKESFDRLIRSEEDLQEKFHYITRNPRDAGVVAANEDYPWVWFPGCVTGSGSAPVLGCSFQRPAPAAAGRRRVCSPAHCRHTCAPV